MIDIGELKAKLTIDQDSALGKLKSGLESAAAIGGKALAGAAAGVAALTTASIKGYAELEQLQGGASKIFGDAADQMEQNALRAAQAMGITQSEYLEQSLSMGSAMVKSLGGDQAKAAEYTDKAMKQMADNASVFGTDMEQVQNAYKGFAKENYTMLDNLKLGYSGTKEGMQELLKDAEAISGVHYDISSYADVIDALQVIQDKQNITGNAAEEASKTISGSLGALKASWSNLVTGFSDPNANMSVLFMNLKESATNFLNNITPFISQVLTTITGMLPAFISTIMEILSTLITESLPQLIDAALNLLSTLGQYVVDNMDALIDMVINVVAKIGSFLVNNIGPLTEGIVTIITKLINKTTENLPQILKAIGKIMYEISKALIKALPDLANAVVDLLKSLGSTLWNNRHLIVDKIKEVFSSAKDAILGVVSGWWDGIKGVFTGGSSTGHRSGLYYVPYDGYTAELHKGERVLTSQEARNYNSSEGSSNVVSNTFNITVPSNDNAMATALRLRELTRKETYGYVV